MLEERNDTETPPKKALEEYFELEELTMIELEKEKRNFNSNAMASEDCSSALLTIENDLLKGQLSDLVKSESKWRTLYFEEKKEKEETISKMMEFNNVVNEHLYLIMDTLKTIKDVNTTFLEKIANRVKIKRMMKKVDSIKNETKEC